MADGIFVGVDEDGNITYDGQRINYQSFKFPNFTNEIEFKPPAIDPADAPTLASGYLEIIREFKSGEETERAKKVLARLGVLGRGPDDVAARYLAYILSVRDWTGDKHIGGDVVVIILERGKNWRWFHRPDYCPEQ